MLFLCNNDNIYDNNFVEKIALAFAQLINYLDESQSLVMWNAKENGRKNFSILRDHLCQKAN